MEIRCPKCKYKFDEAFAPGILEKACVCPRCGTPFIYNIESENNEVGSKDVSDIKHIDSQRTRKSETSEPHKKDEPTTQNNDKSSKPNRHRNTTTLQNRYTDLRMLLSSKTKLVNNTNKKKIDWKETYRSIIIVAAIVFVIVMVVTKCVSNSISDYEADYNNDETTLFERTNVDNTTSMNEESQLISDDNKWIEGSWSTPSKDIEFTFSIRGNQISITDGHDYAVCGKFVIKNNQLLFNNYVFKLDKEHQHIIFNNIKFEQSHFY